MNFTNFKNFVKFMNFYEFQTQQSRILNLWSWRISFETPSAAAASAPDP